jgi:hypothetical protein
MRRYAGRSGKLGSSTMPIKPSGCCAISPVGLTKAPGVAASILEGLDEILTVGCQPVDSIMLATVAPHPRHALRIPKKKVCGIVAKKTPRKRGKSKFGECQDSLEGWG